MSGEWVAELVDCEAVIENELANGCTQRQVAQSYALAMRSTWPTDWALVNAAIRKRWPNGLNRVKEMAHSGKCFE